MRGVSILFCSMALMTTVGSFLEVGAVQRQVWTTSFCRSIVSAATTSSRRMTRFASLSSSCNIDINGGRLLRRRRHIATSFHIRQRCCWGILPLRPRLRSSSLSSHPCKTLTMRHGASLGANSFLNDIVETTLLNEILPKYGPPCDDDRRRVTAVIGVSGGCDSIALLHVLHHLVNHCNTNDSNQKSQPEIKDYDWHLAVAHFDHQQRGAESDGDREFVVDLCRQLHIPVHCYYWSDHMTACTAATGKTPPFSQDTARQWRRQTMQALLLDSIGRSDDAATNQEQRCCGLLLTAHHKDDSEETLLLKLLRGAHISNLSGLTACTPMVDLEREGVEEFDDLNVEYSEMEDDSLQGAPNKSSTGALSCCWARPFIHVRKADLVQYLQDRGLTWRDDASNQSDKYLRNRVRNELLPLLTDLVGNSDRDILSRRLEHLSEQASDVREHLSQQAQRYCDAHVDTTTGTFSLPLQNDGSATSKVVRFDVTSKQALHLWLTRQSHDGHSFSYSHVRRIVRQVEDYADRLVWRLCLGNGWTINRHGNVLQLVRDDVSADSSNPVASKLTEDVAAVVTPWRHLDNNETANGDEIEIGLPVPPPQTVYNFVQSKVGHGQFARCTVTPPWRPNHSPIRLTEFLRGQQVPLHLRHQAAIIALQQKHQADENDEGTLRVAQVATTDVVAVYVVTKKKWVVDALFAVKDDADRAVQTRVAVAVNV